MDEEFSVAHNRFGAYLTQIIPLGLIKAGASLKTVLILYSLSFTLVHYLCWIFAHYVARQSHAAWAIIFLQLLVWDVTYFWPVSEAFLALVYCIAFFAWINGARNKAWLTYLLPVPLLVLLVLFSHPVAMGPLLFLLAYEFLELERSQWKKFAALVGVVCFSILLWRLLSPPPSDYDIALAGNLENFKDILQSFWGRRGPTQLRIFLTVEYKILLYFIGLVLIALLGLRLWKKAFLLVGGLIAYGSLVGIVYQAGESHLIIENICAPFALFAIVFFLKDILPRVPARWTHTAMLLILGFFMATRIWQRKRHLDYKFYWYDNMYTYSQLLGHSKLIMDDHRVNERFRIPWAMAVESTIYTTLKGAKHPLQIYPAADPGPFLEFPNDSSYFPYVPFWKTKAIPIPPNQYFNFQLKPVLYLNQDVTYPEGAGQGHLQAEMFNLEILGKDDVIELREGVANDLQLRISNNSPYQMVSAKWSDNQFYLGYHFGDPCAGGFSELDINVFPVSNYVYNMEVKPLTGKGMFTMSLELHHRLLPGQKLVQTWPVQVK